MIVAKNVSYNIGKKNLLNDVSASIELGKVTAILGPNGAGKSTLLKCLTGVLKPASGSVSLDNKGLHDYSLTQLSKKRAVLSQSNPISFPFTALEIVMMGRNPYVNNNYGNEDFATALEVLECVDAIHLKDRVFPTLSGGEQQRIQLARVLAQLWEQQNAYLFLDEPTSALDLKHQHQILSLVNKAAAGKNLAVCVIMHDLHLAWRYADQVILMKEGGIFTSGTMQKVLTAKNIEYVFEIPAEFVFHSDVIKIAV